MPDSLESALVIALTDTLKWSAALPPLNPLTGTLTSVDPGQPFDVLQYARRDREFQHRDMINAAAVAKVSIHSRTVWSGTLVEPVLQGITGVTGQQGTNVVLPLDPSQVGVALPNSSTAVTYVLNSDVPYASIQVTDVNLYNRDLILYETLARAAALFPGDPPIVKIDPGGAYIGSTSVWATAQGTNKEVVPNAAQAMDQALFKDPDLYLAERDNQIAAYVARIAEALKNPFAFATRIYVQIVSPDQVDTEESETYVLTDNVFVLGSTYTSGDQVLYNGTWYQALNTTTELPPSTSWSAIGGPTKLQFMAEPALDSRNRIVYDTQAKTLQWFRETLDLVHIPQIVGFYIPGILPGQAIQTVPLVPEKKDAQFWRQKSARVNFAAGTWSDQFTLAPTANANTAVPNASGGVNVLFESAKCVALMMPDTMTVSFVNIVAEPGTYAVNCLVRPSPAVDISGGDNQQGSVDTSDGGTTFSAIGDVRNWSVALPAGGWKLFIEFANVSATATASFGIKATQGATPILANTLPLYYTDSNGDPLAQNTEVLSPGIDIQSTGQEYNFAVQWTSGAGQLHIRKLRFEQVSGPSTSHYIMQASWLQAQGTNTSSFDVAGGDNQEGSIEPSDGGCTFTNFNTPLTWDVTLSPGLWEMRIQYSNWIGDGAQEMAAIIYQDGSTVSHPTLPYTDSSNNPLAQFTPVNSSPISILSSGAATTIGIQWQPVAGASGQLHIVKLIFTSLGSLNSVSSLDVVGRANMPDMMPFQFYVAQAGTDPMISVSWLPKSGSLWIAKAYNPGDQVLYNLTYWQATGITTAADVPGQSSLWLALGTEPQIPLIIEQVQLSKFVEASVTPQTVGFQGFRQDMLERALRSDQDAYGQGIIQAGTNLPEFRTYGSIWDINSTGSWIRFAEVYEPRLRRIGAVPTGGITPGHQYEVITQAGEMIIYNGQSYSNGQKFYGVAGVSTYSAVGAPIVNQVGAYRISLPGDVGKTGLVPAGLEFDTSTGTITGWYPSYASYPTHQAVQPWMVEEGLYVADDDLQSPCFPLVSQGLQGTPQNPPAPHPTPAVESFILVPEDSGDQIGFPTALTTTPSLIYTTDNGDTIYTSPDGTAWTTIGAVSGTAPFNVMLHANSLFVVVGNGMVSTSTNAVTWTPRISPTANSMNSLIFGGGRFVAAGDDGDTMVSTNGINWTENPSGASPQNLYTAGYGNGIYLVGGQLGVLYTSANGSSWTPQVSNTGETLFAVAYGLGTYAIAATSSTILTSTDAVNWSVQTVGFNLTDLIFDTANGRFYLGTGNGEVYSTTDFSTYTLAFTGPLARIYDGLVSYTGGAIVVMEQSPPN